MQLRIRFDLEPILLINKREELGEIRLSDSLLGRCPERSRLHHVPLPILVERGQIDLDNLSGLDSKTSLPTGITYSPSKISLGGLWIGHRRCKTSHRRLLHTGQELTRFRKISRNEVQGRSEASSSPNRKG